MNAKSVTSSALRAVLSLVALLACLAGAASAHAAPANYVALGDSYSSGEGTGYSTYNLDVKCRRSTYGYPQLVANQRGNTALKFVACAGAKTSDVINNQISSLSAATNFVTMTIGGNDIGFGDLIKNCTLRNCSSDIATANTKINNVLPASLKNLYTQIRSRASTARVMILSYPRVLGSSGCFATTGISADERTKLGALQDNLNAKIRSATTTAGFTYINSDTRFVGRHVCARPEWINGLNILHPEESYHPNRAGNSEGFTRLVRAVIG